MFWRQLDHVFDTRTWKVVVLLLSIFLLVSFLQLITIAHYSINLTIEKANHYAPEFKNYVENAYYNGILAFIVFAFLTAIHITHIVRDHLIAQQYRSLANIMLNFARGNIAVRHTDASAKEVKHLGETFNSMADSLQGLIEEIQRSETLRKEMVANVAHDLAGPLTTISGYIDTIDRSITTSATNRHKEYLQIIKNNIKSIKNLVCELSDLSKYDVDDFSPDKDLFSLQVLAKDVVSRYALEAKSRNISLQIYESNDNSLIFADMSMIERLISNLIENAIYYTPPNGQISLDFREDQKNVCMIVTDTGIGISDSDLPFVFERFYRIDKDRSRSSGGSGLGLAIVKKIVELHQGSVNIASSPGEGTQIFVKFVKGGDI